MADQQNRDSPDSSADSAEPGSAPDITDSSDPGTENLDSGAAGGDDSPGVSEVQLDLEEGKDPPEDPPETTVTDRGLDKVRAQVARSLVAILAIVVFFSYLTLWLVSPPPTVKGLETLLTIIFGPLVALVSGAVGYYFGGKSGEG